MLNFVNDCSSGSFCQKLRNYLFWLDLATISVDVITEQMLRKSAKEALKEADSSVPEKIKAHLEEVTLEEKAYRSSKARAVAKSLDNAPKKILEFEAANISSEVEVGLIYNPSKKSGRLIGSGKADTISFYIDGVASLKGCIVTHIHPWGSSFSVADFRTFFTQELKELRAVCPDEVVFCLKSKGIKIAEEDFDDLLKKAKTFVEEEFIVGMQQTDKMVIERLVTNELEKRLDGLMEYIQYK